jgi:microsomal epoxide hydrolase
MIRRMSSLRPAPIDVPDADLADLRERLHRTRWPEPLPAPDGEAGADLTAVREICRLWADEYDWRERESELNALDPTLVTIDGLDIHVFRAESGRPDAIPLLLIHGWPGSIVELRYVIPLLTRPAGDGPAFDLVMPSLPGFGFGGKPAEPGWGITRTANAFHELMTTALGHERYAIAGGDWGAIIASRQAQLHPDAVLGFHTQLPLLGEHRRQWWADDADEIERAQLDRLDAFDATGRGYSRIQGTKPQSLALAQTDSPAGLAAWILEKFDAWSDGGLAVFDPGDLITNLMFYWAPRSVASSAAIYYEARLDADARVHAPPESPAGVAAFPYEINPTVRRWVEPNYRLVHYTQMPRGGHFGALEQPVLYADDVRAFIARVI